MKRLIPYLILLLAGVPSFAQRTTSHDINGVRYVSFGPGTPFNWSQAPTSPATLSAGVQATVTISPCPLGVDTTNTATRPYYVYVSTVGTAEAVLVTGGNCTPMAASGTIIFTPANSHSAGYTVGTASTGAQEALNDAQIGVSGTAYKGNFVVKFTPTQPANTAFFAIYARVTVNTGPGEIDGAGASLDCEASDTCFYYGTAAASINTHGFRVASKTVMAGAAITATDCGFTQDQRVTITSTLNPPVGSWVDVELTDNPYYWNLHQVSATAAGSFKWVDTSCTGGGTIASQTTPGNTALLHTVFRDNGTQNTFRDITLDAPAWSTALSLNHVIVVENDQAFSVRGLNSNSAGLRCDANYCGDMIYNPGPFSVNPAVGAIDTSNLSPNCGGNGVTWRGGNTLNISNTVIQGTAQYDVQTGILQGGFGATTIYNVYGEVGNCSNPLFTQAGLSAGGPARSIAGINSLAGIVTENAAIGTAGSLGGQEPKFTTGGVGNDVEYWVVITDGTRGVALNTSMPLRFGQAAPPNGSAYTIAWPRYGSPTGGTVTYDILKTTGIGSTLLAPIPGSTQSIALATNVAQCSGLVCTLSDTQPALSSYVVAANPGLTPALVGWAGSATLGSGGLLYTTDLPTTNVSGIIPTKQNEPTVFAQRCGAGTPGVWVNCLTGFSNGNNNAPVGSVLLQMQGASGAASSNLKGRLNFLWSPFGSLNPGELFTLVDSNPGATLADFNHRPAQAANDTYFGLDNGNVAFSAAQLATGAPVAQSQYIGSVPDGTNWKTRLTAALQSYQVPISAGSFDNILFADGTTGTNHYATLCSALAALVPGTNSIVYYTAHEVGANAWAKDPFNDATCGNGKQGYTVYLGAGTIMTQWPVIQPSGVTLIGAGRGSEAQINTTNGCEGSSPANTNCNGTLLIACNATFSGNFQMHCPGGTNFPGGLISTIARSTNVVTIQTSAVHNFTSAMCTAGTYIHIQGVTGGTTNFNGDFVCTGVPDTTHITYAQSGSNESGTAGAASTVGSAVLTASQSSDSFRVRDINFTISSAGIVGSGQYNNQWTQEGGAPQAMTFVGCNAFGINVGSNNAQNFFLHDIEILGGSITPTSNGTNASIPQSCIGIFWSVNAPNRDIENVTVNIRGTLTKGPIQTAIYVAGSQGLGLEHVHIENCTTCVVLDGGQGSSSTNSVEITNLNIAGAFQSVTATTSCAGTTETITTASPHFLMTGQSVTLSAVTGGCPGGSHVIITSTGATTFTFTIASTTSSGTATITSDPYAVVYLCKAGVSPVAICPNGSGSAQNTTIHSLNMIAVTPVFALVDDFDGHNFTKAAFPGEWTQKGMAIEVAASIAGLSINCPTGISADAFNILNATVLAFEMTCPSGLVTTYGGEAGAGRGLVFVRGVTSQKAETTTADTNVLTVTPAATVGTYRACVVISVSAATSGVISWTLSWKDSNGTAQSNIAQDLFQQGTAAPNTTFTTSSAGNYNGCTTFDVDNSATAVIVKWVGGGTTTAKMTAFVERII